MSLETFGFIVIIIILLCMIGILLIVLKSNQSRTIQQESESIAQLGNKTSKVRLTFLLYELNKRFPIEESRLSSSTPEQELLAELDNFIDSIKINERLRTLHTIMEDSPLDGGDVDLALRSAWERVRHLPM